VSRGRLPIARPSETNPETLRGGVERDASTRDVLAAAGEAQLA